MECGSSGNILKSHVNTMNDQTTFIDTEMDQNKHTFMNISSKLEDAPAPKFMNKPRSSIVSNSGNPTILYQD